MKKCPFQRFILFFAAAILAFIESSSAFALDRNSSSPFGISVAGQLPAVTGPFAPVLTPQLGGSVRFDIAAPLLKGKSRLFGSAGLQNYSVNDSDQLALNTFEFLAGIGFQSEPYIWVIAPTLNLGLGATVGTLQIDSTTSEIQNSAAYFTTLVSPGLSAQLFAGFSVGIEMPVRWILSQNRITTLSPALNLRYEL